MIPADGFWKWSLFRLTTGGYSASFASDLPLAAIMSRNARPTAPISSSDQKYPVVFETCRTGKPFCADPVNEGKAVSNELLRGRVDGVKVGENPKAAKMSRWPRSVNCLDSIQKNLPKKMHCLLPLPEKTAVSFENIPYGHWIVRRDLCP